MIKGAIDWMAYMIHNNPVLIILIFCVSIIGFIVTLIALCITVKQSKKKTLCFSYQNNELVGGKLSEVDELDIFYKGKKVNNLTVATIEIYNDGNGAIKPCDFIEGREIKIMPSDPIQILFAKIIIPDNSDPKQTINCELPYTTDEGICMTFKCLREKEKIIINIYHTGTRASKFEIDAVLEEGNIVNTSYIMDKRKKQLEALLNHIAEFLVHGI